MVNNAFYIGTGKVEEVKNLVSMLDADCVRRRRLQVQSLQFTIIR